MPRPKRDGTPARSARRRKLTERFVQHVRGEAAAFAVWDTHQRGLALRVQPTHQRSWKAVYSFHGRACWYHIGDASKIGLTDARRIAAKVMLAVAEGKDPVAERQAERGSCTFGDLYDQYLAQHAKRKNKSWEQSHYLVASHLLPRWAKLDAKTITRGDVRQAIERVASPSVANQTLAAASAVFSWAVKQEKLAANLCKGIERHEMKSRERVLSDAEVALFWKAFDSTGLVRGSALKALLLTGQRPGEIARMRREHVVEGWWEMPGESVASLGWPGTKNGQSHRVWLVEPVRAIIAELADEATTGFAFANDRGTPITDLDGAMRQICDDLGIESKVTPHDLRRTFSTVVTRLGFGRDALNRVTNHKEGGIASVYDRHSYAVENQRIMEAVAAHITALAEGKDLDANIVRLSR
jgi:integrase